MSSFKTVEGQSARETVEFDALPADWADPATRETVDDKMVIELLSQLLLSASQTHRTFLEQQEQLVRELMKRIPENPRLVESELLKVYQQIKASFTRLSEAIGDLPHA
jgi:hypothetical protein